MNEKARFKLRIGNAIVLAVFTIFFAWDFLRAIRQGYSMMDSVWYAIFGVISGALFCLSFYAPKSDQKYKPVRPTL